jgi:hypothetical protein
MSHWTTSGRSRLKAKQSQSFSYRARQRASLVNRDTLPIQGRRSRESTRTTESGSRSNYGTKHRAVKICYSHRELILSLTFLVGTSSQEHRDQGPLSQFFGVEKRCQLEPTGGTLHAMTRMISGQDQKEIDL